MQTKAPILMIIFTLSCAYALPAAQEDFRDANCRRQTEECSPKHHAGLPSYTCCARLVCYNEGNGINKCRLQNSAGCIAERGYCGINGPDMPCCPDTECLQAKGDPNSPWLCRWF
ncbi:uncharacterized protein J3D65DRAFT_635255 [Phyllosticta citribraziliensis]|uniref:Uncharacterized protein n=1 Tax=Phyllosticta citribraziliensis TaxID=989973 RepID=A0ABR1LFF9_9PEZI